LPVERIPLSTRFLVKGVAIQNLPTMEE